MKNPEKIIFLNGWIEGVPDLIFASVDLQKWIGNFKRWRVRETLSLV